MSRLFYFVTMLKGDGCLLVSSPRFQVNTRSFGFVEMVSSRKITANVDGYQVSEFEGNIINFQTFAELTECRALECAVC
jgi:hypothetical protein